MFNVCPALETTFLNLFGNKKEASFGSKISSRVGAVSKLADKFRFIELKMFYTTENAS